MALPSRRLNAPGPPAAIAAKAITAGNRINLFEFKTSVSVQKLYATATIKNRILGSRQFEEHPPSRSLYRLTSAGLADVIELIMDHDRTDILEIAFATLRQAKRLNRWPQPYSIIFAGTQRPKPQNFSVRAGRQLLSAGKFRRTS